MRFVDTLYNFVSGLGTAKDKSSFNQFARSLMTREQIEAAYRSDWIARKIITVPVQDATREWRDWQADAEQIEKIETLEKDLDVQRKLSKAMRLGRLYGGGALILGVEGAGTMDQPLDVERVREGSLKFIHAVSRYEITTGEINTDLTSEMYGEPAYYERVSAIVGTTIGSSQFRIHPTRVIRFLGNPYPSDDVAGADAWSDSVMETVADAVKQVGAVVGGIAALVNEAKVDVVKIPDLMKNLTTKEYAGKLQTRFELANIAKSHTNTIMLDKEEDWERITTSFTALPDVLKVYLLIAAGAADIPATRLIGQSAQGLNATGEGDLKNYYDRVRSDQENELSPVLTRLDEVIIRSALGTRDPAIYYLWAPLYTLDEVQKADLASKKADTMQKDVTAGLISLEVLAEARKNQLLEDGTYPGLESALEEFDVETPPAEETRLLSQQSQQKLLAAPTPGESDPNGNGSGGGAGGTPSPKDPGKKPFGDGMFFDFNENHEPGGSEHGGEFAEGEGGHGGHGWAAALVTLGAAGAVVSRIAHAINTPDHAQVHAKADGSGSIGFAKQSSHADATKDLKKAGFVKESTKSSTNSTKMGRSQAHSSSKEQKTAFTHVDGHAALIKTVTQKYGPDKEPRTYYTVTINPIPIKKDSIAEDAAPRTLYVRRYLLNADAVISHFKAQGLETTLPADEMHVTIIYSRQAVDWMKIGEEYPSGGTLKVSAGGPRIVERLGDGDAAIVLLFASSQICWRHEDMKRSGASFDYPEYQPHVTITYNSEGIDVDALEPYVGELLFGPEIFEEITEDYMSGVTEDGDKPGHEFHGNQWTKGYNPDESARKPGPNDRRMVEFKSVKGFVARMQFQNKADQDSYMKSEGRPASDIRSITNMGLSETGKAVTSYSSNERTINAYLRGEAKLTGEAKDKVDNIIGHLSDAIDKSTMNRDATLYRGVAGTDYGLDFYSKKVGQEVTLDGFVSTTKSRDVAAYFAKRAGKDPSILELSISKGQHALDLSSVGADLIKTKGGYVMGEEVLLPHKTRVRVDGVHKKIVRLTVL